MKRLTEKWTKGYDLKVLRYKSCDQYCKKQPIASCCNCGIFTAIQKLAEYEDLEEIFRSKMTDETCSILSDKEEFAKWLDRIAWTAKKLDEYGRAEEQRKLIRLPVAVGDVVYVLTECENIPEQPDGTLGDIDDPDAATGFYCPYEYDCPFPDDGFVSCDKHRKQTAVFEDYVTSIRFSEDDLLAIFTNNCLTGGLFGRDVFLAKEAAENALKARLSKNE